MSGTKLRICKKCRWAHFPLTREAAEKQAREFGDYINAQTPEIQAKFGFGPLARTPKQWDFKEYVSHSERCFRCGNAYTNFRDETDTDHIPVGCTLQSIIKEGSNA